MATIDFNRWFISNVEYGPIQLKCFECVINVPALDISSLRLWFFGKTDLQLDANCMMRVLHQLVRLWDYDYLQPPRNNCSDRLEFFVATREHLQQPNFIDYLSNTDATKILMLPSYQQFPRHEEFDELPVLVSQFIYIYEGLERNFFFKFMVYRLDDGTISLSEIHRIVLHDLLASSNFPSFQRAMRSQEEIRFFVGTSNHCRNPMVIDIFFSFRRFVYQGQYRGNSRLSDEEGRAVLGSARRCIERLDGEETDCAICLDSIRRGEEVKVLACEHVYHYECILRSTLRKRECPLCRASYG